MARYEAGETLASIARTYDCSPPAISYIVSRNRDKPANETPPPTTAEPLLIKAHSNGSAANGSGAAMQPEVVPAVAPAVTTRPAEPPPYRTSVERPLGAPAAASAHGPAAPGNGEHRPKLHLGFGNSNGNGNGHAPQPQAQQTPRPFQAPPRPNPYDNGRANHDLAAPRDTRPSDQMMMPPPPPMPRDDAPVRKNGAAALDQELRSRVDGDITAFLAAFDAVLAGDSQESRFGLKEATDRLLRAGARTRIELERLEAKVPLPPRDGAGHAEPAGWRYR